MTYKIFLKIFIVSFLIKVVIALITTGIALNSLVMFIVFFYFTYFCITKLESQQSSFRVFTTVFVANVVIESYGIYLYFVNGNSGLPYVFLNLVAITSGFLYFRLRPPSRFLQFLLASFFSVFMFYQGWDYWIDLV
jgi:hypothetical protein